MTTYWLDFGGGDAEYAEYLSFQPFRGDRRLVTADPVLRRNIIDGGHCRASRELPSSVVRVGAGLGPSDDCVNPFLPFADEVFDNISCRYVLHLYLTVVEPFAAEAYRTLKRGGQVLIRLPDWGNQASKSNLRFICEAMEQTGFTVLSVQRAPDEGVSFWDEVYSENSCVIEAIKPG